MHQYGTVANIICVEIFNLKVVYGNRCFEQLMLYLLDNNVLSVNCEKYIAGFKMDCVSPALAWYVERVRRRCDYLFIIAYNPQSLLGLAGTGEILHKKFYTSKTLTFIMYIVQLCESHRYRGV